MQSRQMSAPGCWLSQANLSTQEMKAETTPPSSGSCLQDILVGVRTGCSPNADTSELAQEHFSPLMRDLLHPEAALLGSASVCELHSASQAAKSPCVCPQKALSTPLWVPGLASTHTQVFRDSRWQRDAHPYNFSDWLELLLKLCDPLSLPRKPRLPENSNSK